MRVDPVSAGLSKLTCVSDGCTYIDSQSIQVAFLFDSTSDMIVGLDPGSTQETIIFDIMSELSVRLCPTNSKTRHVLYQNPSILAGKSLHVVIHTQRLNYILV